MWKEQVHHLRFSNIPGMIIDCHNHVGTDLLFYLHGDFPYAQHLVAMHDEGRALGVDRWMVFPFVSMPRSTYAPF
jgi:hypothetical protein